MIRKALPKRSPAADGCEEVRSGLEQLQQIANSIVTRADREEDEHQDG